MILPPWKTEAEKFIGTKEYPGAKSNPAILYFWKMAKLAGIKDDAVPWCAGFACAMLESVGVRSPRSDGAKNFLAWGQALSAPVIGCVAVMKREGGWHVAFVVGKDRAGNLLCLGGNQGDEVNVRAFHPSRVVAGGYRWPSGYMAGAPLPTFATTAQSLTEA